MPSGVDTDLLGEARIQNGTVSLGAYEQGVTTARLALQATPGAETGTFALSNLGNADVTGAVVDLGLPTGVSITGDSGNGGVTDGTWTVGVSAGDTATVRVDMERDASVDPGQLDLTANLDSYTVEGGAHDATRPEDTTAEWALLEAPYGPALRWLSMAPMTTSARAAQPTMWGLLEKASRLKRGSESTTSPVIIHSGPRR